MYRRPIHVALGVLVAGVALAATAHAGGQSLSVRFPDPARAPRSADAALYVHALNCGAPAAATLTARAEGMVGGERRTVKVALEPTGKRGIYAVKRQWPAEGRWVLVVTWKDHEHASALVALDGAGVGKAGEPRVEYGPVSADEIMAALASR